MTTRSGTQPNWTELDNPTITLRQWGIIVGVLVIMHILAFSPWISSLLQAVNKVTVQTIQMRLSQGGEILVNTPPPANATVALPEEAAPGNGMEMAATPEANEEPASAGSHMENAMAMAREMDESQKPASEPTPLAKPAHGVNAVPVPKPEAPALENAAADTQTGNTSASLGKVETVQEKRVKMSAAVQGNADAASGAGSGQGIRMVRGQPGVTTEQQKAAALVVSRYEQLLSGWIEQHRRMPEEALNKGMSGRALVYIRIDRGGNILFSRLEKRTGQSILDKAVMDMIRRANPVPPVPTDYPPGDQLAFRIPVNFTAAKQ
ncbi:TonB family protein [bacterium]|nr:TonB family protein [bacterium]